MTTIGGPAPKPAPSRTTATATATATTTSSELHPRIGAGEPDDATRKTMSKTIGTTSSHGAPALPHGQADAAAIYDELPTPSQQKAFDAGKHASHDLADLAHRLEVAQQSGSKADIAKCEAALAAAVKKAGVPNDEKHRDALLAGVRAAASLAGHGHGAGEAVAHVVEQGGHAVETAHHAAGAKAAAAAKKAHVHAAHSMKGVALGAGVGVALLPGAAYFAAKDIRKATRDASVENVTAAAGSTAFAGSVGIGVAKGGMALAKVGARFTPGLNVAAAVADGIWAAAVIADPKASTGKKVAAGVAALGSAVSATNFPIASQIGAAIATGGTLLSTFL